MNQATTQIMSETSAETRTLVKQAMMDLNERLQVLEVQAAEKEAELQRRNAICKQLTVSLVYCRTLGNAIYKQLTVRLVYCRTVCGWGSRAVCGL